MTCFYIVLVKVLLLLEVVRVFKAVYWYTDITVARFIAYSSCDDHTMNYSTRSLFFMFGGRS